MRMELVLRFDYGRIVPWVRRLEDDTRIAIAGPDAVAFRTPVDVRGENLSTVADFTVEAGERIPFVLTWFPSHLDPPRAITPDHAYQDTCEYWDEWLVPCTFGGRYAEAVFRSLMVLKAMTYGPTGGIVAAPTTSLPEQIGGVRNWDYRYCWLRDASFALSALVGNGFVEEAGAWRSLAPARRRRRPGGHPDHVRPRRRAATARVRAAVARGLRGLAAGPGRQRREHAVPARRLRRGRSTSSTRLAGAGSPADDSAWALLRHLIQSLETRWREPDEGIWEVRGPRRHFTHSKVMAWVAFDRGLRLIDELGRDGPKERWRGDPRRDQGRGAGARLRRGARLVRPVLRLEAARREPPDDPALRLPSRRRPARPRHARGGAPRAARRRLRPALPPRPRASSRSTACRRARAPSSSARSGSWTT